MESKGGNKMLWLALIGLGVYHLYSKGYRIGKVNSDRESKEDGTFASGGGGFIIPILNARIYKKGEPKKEDPKLAVKEGGLDVLKESDSISDEEVKTALSSIEKDSKIDPTKLPTTTMGMDTTAKTESPKTSTTSSLSTTDLSSVKLGALEPVSKFIDFTGDDLDIEELIAN